MYKLSNLYMMGNTMPSKAPPIDSVLAARLTALGDRIRAHRRRHKVTATSAAEAAGMSRVTLHRIERGEPSVTMGAYLSALDAVGLELDVVDPREHRAGGAVVPGVPAGIRLDDHPQLKRLAWHLHGVTEVTPAQALSLYERNWRHLDHDAMTPGERALIQGLAAMHGAGRPLV